MVSSSTTRFRARVRRRGRHVLHGALPLSDFAVWLATQTREVADLDDPALWGFADAVQAAANRVARGELAAPEATAELLTRAESRRFLRP
jgi:hypothetical protein